MIAGFVTVDEEQGADMDGVEQTAGWPAGPGDNSPGDNSPGGEGPGGDGRDTARGGLPRVGRITLSKTGELACKAVLVLVVALYAVLMWVSYTNAKTALLQAGETAQLAQLLPLGFDITGTVLVALSLVLAVKESRGQLVTRVYGVVLVATSAGIGAWYGHQIGGGWVDWFVAAHGLMAVTLAVFAESCAWLLRARIDAAIGVERVPVVLCLTNPRAWREANLYRLRHRSPVSSALVFRDENIKAVSRVVEAAQEEAGYKGGNAKKVRAAIMRACRDGSLPVEAIERACENGLDEAASRRLLVDAAKAMLAGAARGAISGRQHLAELLGRDQETAGKNPENTALELTWDDARTGKDPGKIPENTGKILERGHNVSDDRMSTIVATVEQATGKHMTIPEIAYALSISTARATAIRKNTPKARINGSARHS